MELTLSVRSFHVPATPGTSAWPPSFPSLPTSRATRVTSDANEFNWSTIVFMVSLSSRISPFTSTVIFLFSSPRATAVVTSAMFRTCAVRLPAIELTLSVRSFQVPPTPFTRAWPPSLPSVPTSRATRVTSDANELSWSTIVLMVFFSSRISPFTSTVIFLDRKSVVSAELPFGADFAGHAGHFGGERAELVHHRVDRVLQLEDFPLHVDGDLL